MTIDAHKNSICQSFSSAISRDSSFNFLKSDWYVRKKSIELPLISGNNFFLGFQIRTYTQKPQAHLNFLFHPPENFKIFLSSVDISGVKKMRNLVKLFANHFLVRNDIHIDIWQICKNCVSNRVRHCAEESKKLRLREKVSNLSPPQHDDDDVIIAGCVACRTMNMSIVQQGWQTKIQQLNDEGKEINLSMWSNSKKKSKDVDGKILMRTR